MARMTNKTAAPALDTDKLVTLFVTAESFDSTEDNPTSVQDFASELGWDETEAFSMLGILEDAELMDLSGRGLNSVWWIAVPDVSADNAESVAREALNNFTPETLKPARKATEAKPKAPAKPVATPAPAEAPKAAESPVTPVPEAPKVEAVPKGEPFNFDMIIGAINESLKHASNDPTNYVAPDEVTNLPARPEGVNENVWYMVFNAHSVNEFSTLRARLFWTERAKTQAVA